MTTLQQCALRSLRRHLSVYNVLQAFRLAQQFEVTDWGRELQEACITFVKDTYETLRDVTSRAELEEHFGQAFVQQLELQVLQRQQTLRSLSIRGQVADHAPPVPAVAEEQGQAPQVALSVSGASVAVPYAALKAGLAWPPSVQPDRREAHLSAAEFEQRAHQNSLENQPIFLSLLTLSGLQYPVTAASFGALYLAGRIGYVQGYSTGDPQKRVNYVTALGYVGIFGLVGTTIKFAADLLSK